MALEKYQSEFTAEDFENAIRAVPNIGPNGNWFIGENDTGVFAGGVKVEGAEVGQTIVVKAVDENGVPTEWEPVDMNSELPLLFSTTVTEPTTTLEITTDNAGNRLSLDEWEVMVHVPGLAAYEPKVYLYVIDGDTGGLMFAFAYNDGSAYNVLRYRSLHGCFTEVMANKYSSAAYNQHYQRCYPNGVHSSAVKIYTYNNGNTPLPVGTVVEVYGR